MSCLDWLGAALGRIAWHSTPSGLRYDPMGRLHVVTEPSTFEQFVEGTFGQLRPYMRRDRNTALHVLKVIAEIAQDASPEQRAVLRVHADALLEGAEAELAQETDREEVRHRHRTLLRILTGHENYDEQASRIPWVGGTA